MVWIKWFGLFLVTLIALLACLMTYGSWRWNRSTTALLARLDAARQPHEVVRYDARELVACQHPCSVTSGPR